MALNKEKILNELGSVMNQLQSANCGCMGKLFGNSGQTTTQPNAVPTYGGCRGCCHSQVCGWNSGGSCGKSCSKNVQNMYGPSMRHCNPPKLYADTYNYLTENLMHPAVKEVYNDLKDLTPANTVVNNPMANQMISQAGQQIESRFSQNPTSYQNNAGDTTVNNHFNTIKQTPNTTSTLINNPNQMGGMGPQIMNMLGDNISNKNNIMDQKGHPSVAGAQQSPHSQLAVTPLSAPMRLNQSVYNTNVQDYTGNQNVTHNMTNAKYQSGRDTTNTKDTNPALQQMTAPHHYSHGQHNQGVAKFNEMFPGVMKGLDGDLGFDPIQIAIQMNPENKQQTAINSLHKMVYNNDVNKGLQEPANAAALHAGYYVSPTNNATLNTEQYQIQSNESSSKQTNQIQRSSPLRQSSNALEQPHITPTNEMTYSNTANYKTGNVCGYDNSELNNQQVYIAGSGEPVPHQQSQLQPDQQQLLNSQQYQQQYFNNPNTDGTNVPPNFPTFYESVTGQQNISPESPNTQEMIRKERILPADTSRYIPSKPNYSEFNTLGQPVEMLSANMYRTPEPRLPQTLSPQPTQKSKYDPANYSKVKSTVSKTSLINPKPIGRSPNHLQQIYNQYKGSQSYTQQNITSPAVNNVTHSEGKLNAPQVGLPTNFQQMPIETIAGDTVANNKLREERIGVEKIMGHIGDVPTPNVALYNGVDDKVIPGYNRKSRNGLQDIVYTSYPSSTAWSFHGANKVPVTAGYRYYKQK